MVEYVLLAICVCVCVCVSVCTDSVMNASLLLFVVGK